MGNDGVAFAQSLPRETATMPKHFPPIGAPCWFELASSDPDASMAFHQGLFGWQGTTQDMGEVGTYTFLRNGTGTIGALCGLPPDTEGRPSAWGIYFAVASVDDSVAKARDLGGQLVFEPFDVPGHGRGAVLSDPTGAVFSLWQSAQGDAGDFTMFEDHAIGWVELASRDAGAARSFYSSLLGWTFSTSSIPVPGAGDYLEYGVGATRYGGILPMTKEWGDMPSHWSVYVPVPDVDACLQRAATLGGKICVPAFDAPGVGRIGRVDDPTGAGTYVIQLAKTG